MLGSDVAVQGFDFRPGQTVRHSVDHAEVRRPKGVVVLQHQAPGLGPVNGVPDVVTIRLVDAPGCRWQ